MSSFCLLSELRTNIFVYQIVDIVEASAHILSVADTNRAIRVILAIVPRSNIVWTVLWAVKGARVGDILWVVGLPEEVIWFSGCFLFCWIICGRFWCSVFGSCLCCCCVLSCWSGGFSCCFFGCRILGCWLCSWFDAGWLVIWVATIWAQLLSQVVLEV